MPSVPILSLLLAFVLLLPSSLPAQPPVDQIFHNANVLVCDPGMQVAEAIAIAGGRIAAVGSDAEILALRTQQTRVENLEGKTLTPGFIDSHLHFVGLGQSLQMLDLSTAESWQDVVDQVAEAAKLLPPGTWIEGRGWHQSKWNIAPAGNVDGYPSHQSMSELVPEHPVVLTHASGHACFANAAAMELAQVTASTSDPAGGEILKDAAGQPIGVFRENAQGLIRRAKSRGQIRSTPEQRRAQLVEQLRLAGEACLENGITSVHDAGSSFDQAESLAELADAGQLPVRMFLMLREPSQTLETKMPGSRIDSTENGFLTVRGVKISLDGALGPHGAWLLQPYSDLPATSGLNTVPLDECQRIAELCKQQGWQLCIHAIGDRANREVLDLYQSVLGEDVPGDHRWRVEHAQHLAAEDIARFGQLGVIPAMQANHCTSDAPFVPQRLGERRAATGAYMWRSLIDGGAIVPNGTDAPVEKVDPRASLFAAVTRELSNGMRFYPEQCMSRREALLSYTLWPAMAAFRDADLGSLDTGKRADFVVWDTDLLNCPVDQILTAQVKRTVLAGETVYKP